VPDLSEAQVKYPDVPSGAEVELDETVPLTVTLVTIVFKPAELKLL
jgi:hypothetical protein